MRESEQTKLEYRLHQQIMASIITIQRWFRAVLERRRFLALRRASVVIQYFCRYVSEFYNWSSIFYIIVFHFFSCYFLSSHYLHWVSQAVTPAYRVHTITSNILMNLHPNIFFFDSGAGNRAPNLFN